MTNGSYVQIHFTVGIALITAFISELTLGITMGWNSANHSDMISYIIFLKEKGNITLVVAVLYYDNEINHISYFRVSFSNLERLGRICLWWTVSSLGLAFFPGFLRGTYQPWPCLCSEMIDRVYQLQVRVRHTFLPCLGKEFSTLLDWQDPLRDLYLLMYEVWLTCWDNWNILPPCQTSNAAFISPAITFLEVFNLTNIWFSYYIPG